MEFCLQKYSSKTFLSSIYSKCVGVAFPRFLSKAMHSMIRDEFHCHLEILEILILNYMRASGLKKQFCSDSDIAYMSGARRADGRV